MKGFDPLEFDALICRRELEEFGEFLRGKPLLSERDDILPFFRGRRHLSAFLGSCNPDIVETDRIAFEYDLFGDFTCDLVIGDFDRRAYCFVEFEEGGASSIFKKRGKSTPEWSTRFDHGYSQVIDWYWKLQDAGVTVDFAHRFGEGSIHYNALLVIGRSGAFGVREEKRLDWRRKSVVVDSRRVDCITFDKLHETLTHRLMRYSRPDRTIL